MNSEKESTKGPLEKHLEFFRLLHNPFPVAPDNTDFYMSRHNDAVIDKLSREIISRKGFMLLTGDVGLGKTTLSRQLIKILEQHQVETCLILQSFFQGTSLLKEIIKDFGMVTEETGEDLPILMNLLNDFLLKKNREGVNCAILIDDAQNLTIESLELIRMISNLEADREKLVQILLVGQPELLEKLNCHELRQLKSRVTIRQTPVPLEKQEIGKYIQFKLNRSGDSGRVTLMPKTLKKLYQLTSGNLRRINILMDRALRCAFEESTPVITPRHIKKADREIAFEISSWKTPFLKPSFVIFFLILIIMGMAGGSVLFLSSSIKKEPVRIEKADAQAIPNNPSENDKAFDSIRNFLLPYGLESFATQFADALDRKDFTGFQTQVFNQTGLRLIHLSVLPDSVQTRFDVLSKKDKDSGKTEYFLFWKPYVTILKFYFGYTGEEISRIQQLLFNAGLYDHHIDGIVGQRMMKSVKEFQAEHDLPATGFPDPETIFLLANMNR